MTMPIIFAGTPENAAKSLESLIQAGVEIALVITREDAPVGRKRVLTPSPVASVAEHHRLPILKANQILPSHHAQILATKARIAVVVAYGALLKQETLDLLETGWFNLHYSLLPRWRGASPVQSALLAGDDTTGVTLFKIDAGMDTGPIVGAVQTPIEVSENSLRLLDRLTALGVSLLLQELPKMQAGIHSLDPQIGEPTAAPKYSREDARINAENTGIDAIRKIHAFNPEPMAWVVHRGNPLRLLEGRLSKLPIPAGSIEEAKDGALFGFGDTSVLVTELQPAGKSKMSAADFLRGVPIAERSFE